MNGTALVWGHHEPARLLLQLNGIAPTGGHHEPASGYTPDSNERDSTCLGHHESPRSVIQLNGTAPA
jgi:hypothetical protein